jgi:prepilin-type N-terminal cleavage/methylation domain-containing protein
MCAKSSECRRSPVRGFTMVELLVVIVMLGVLAAVVMPKMDSALGLRSDAARDEVLSALRYAGQTALSHRRLVCADVSATAVTLRIASTRPASACNSALVGPDGGSAFTANAGNAALAVAPAGTLYFQPDGRVTTDGAGANAAARTVTVAGTPDITVTGETGLVR